MDALMSSRASCARLVLCAPSLPHFRLSCARATQVEAMLRTQGRVTVDEAAAKGHLHSALRCNRCGGGRKRNPRMG